MATFSDMVTLLLTFFVLLMSMASFDDPAKVEAVFESIRQAFGAGGMEELRLGASTEPQNATSDERLEQSIQPIASALRQALAEHVSDDLIRMVQDEQELRIRLDDRILFRPGSAELHPAAYALLGDVADQLSEQEVEIRIEAHTDANGSEEKNWEVSASRSLTVVRALRERGPIDGERLQGVAYGQFRPATTFGEAAAWNRRVELVLRSDHRAAAGAALDLLDRGAAP